MGIGFNLSLVMRSKCARTWLDVNPSPFFSTHLAFITFTAVADEMAASVGTHLLSAYFLAADSTDEVGVDIFYDYIS